MSLTYDPTQPTRLENWVPIDFQGRMKLCGDVYNHPRRLIVRDGQDTITTHLVAYDPEAKIGRTKTGTRYLLDKPHFTGGARYWKILEDLNLPKEI